LVYIHVFLDLVSMKDPESAIRVRDKYFNLVKQWYPFVEELHTIDVGGEVESGGLDVKLGKIKDLRGKIAETKRDRDKHQSQYTQLMASEVPPGEFGSKLAAKIHTQTQTFNTFVKDLEAELEGLKSLETTAALRCQRGVVGMVSQSDERRLERSDSKSIIPPSYITNSLLLVASLLASLIADPCILCPPAAGC